MKSLNQRVDHIRNQINEIEKERNQGKEIETFTIKSWRDSKLTRPIIRLHVDYLMYRIENSRTFREQLQYLQQHPDINQNFFKDPESLEVQKIQEEILLNMIENGALGESFLLSLKESQDEPTIITYQGYIVNGNRRTAALKKMDKVYINCVVLPEDATLRDIYTIEHLEQISEDFKEDYHWINELNNFYIGMHDKSLRFSKTEMAKSFRISKPELESKLRMKDLIDEFLEWKGIPGEYYYDKLDKSEEAFRQLEKEIKNIKDEIERRDFINAVFTLIDKPPTKGRLYSHVRDLIRDWKTVYSRILEKQVKIDPSHTEVSNIITPNAKAPINKVKHKDGNIITELFKPNQEHSHVEVFSDSKNTDEMSSAILETIADVKAERKEQNEAEAFYESVSSALRELQGLVINTNSIKLDSAEKKLQQIIKISEDLIQKLKMKQF
ncbi:MAG: hypothetical protein ACYC59_08630 [Anaerolineaceae bacterium]